MLKIHDMDLIGREPEIESLNNLLSSRKSELCAVVGRRRVGKTFLIKSCFKDQFYFQFSGLYNADLDQHLERCSKAMKEQMKLSYLPVLASWFDVFDFLKNHAMRSRLRKKKIIFLDEFPWMATHKSSFLTAFTDFWNSWAAARHDIVIVICGSSASWMINNIFRNKGGLYNRVTERIELQPFHLKETEDFFKAKHLKLKRDDIIKLYMVMGGIPFYLDQVRDESADQAIQRLYFRKNGILKLEYDELFTSLYDNAVSHESIVHSLSEHTKGLTRTQLIKLHSFITGGGLTRILDELELSGFITRYVPFGKKSKDAIYKLTDPFTLFYVKYVLHTTFRSGNVWTQLTKTPSWQSWSGLAFENICMLHTDKIKRKLKIEGIYTEESKWQHKGNDEMYGAEIDLLIDRADNVINLCEIKYASTPFVIDKDYSEALNKKHASFQFFTKTRKAIFVTLITANGLVKNKYSLDLVTNEVTANDLF